jgi:hypothetical protein
MIGKIFRPFSNDWKKFSAQVKCKKSARGKRKERKGFDAKNAKAGCGRDVGGKREEGCYKNISNAAARTWIAVRTRTGCPQRWLETNVLFIGSVPIFFREKEFVPAACCLDFRISHFSKKP